MRDSNPYPIIGLFDNVTETNRVYLSKIQRRTILLLKLNHAVNALLPASLRLWCRVANIRQGVMVLETANASWQMRLRYVQPQLLSALRAQILPSLLSIDIRINPSLAIKQKLKVQNHDIRRQDHLSLWRKQRQLSAQSAMSIRYVAARSEGKLKNALERLAKLAEEKVNLTHREK